MSEADWVNYDCDKQTFDFSFSDGSLNSSITFFIGKYINENFNYSFIDFWITIWQLYNITTTSNSTNEKNVS